MAHNRPTPREMPSLPLQFSSAPLVGNMPSFETAKVVDHFKGVLLSKLTNIVYDALKQTDQSVLNISSQVESLSEYAQSRLSQDFANYGVGLEMFTIISSSVKEDDPSYIRLKEAKDIADYLAANYWMHQTLAWIGNARTR